jgi:hypothetical protein
MRFFTFEPAEHRGAFAAEDWVHIRGGVTPWFLEELRTGLAARRAAAALRGPGLAGEKVQHLFDTADLTAFCAELFDVVAGVCGLDRSRMTLSERHLKVYEADADPEPVAHKDRFASQISVGLAIDIPAGSRLVLWPTAHRAVNRFLTTEHRRHLAPDERPEQALADAPAVEIADSPGDVVLFPGSSTWHLRRQSAGAALVYLKVNDFDCDPLGEDPTTPARRAATLAALEDDEALDDFVATPARRLESVTVAHGRDGHTDTFATLFGEERRLVPEAAVELLRAADGVRTVATLCAGDPGRRSLVRTLAELGGLDLLPEPYPSASVAASATASAIAEVVAGTPVPRAATTS